ncbi:MAG: SBBP repeat-containing protein, partial [Bacteroidetes bacterium]|nr:SBBP repeat-containing protein [Bacteroidota bacterium]
MKKIIPILLLLFTSQIKAQYHSDNVNLTSYVNYAENKGQWIDKVLYQGDYRGGRIFLEKNAFTYLFYPSAGLGRHSHSNNKDKNSELDTLTFQSVRMEFKNSNLANIEGGDKKSFYNNYFIGNDPQHWASGASVYGNILYKNIYPGIMVTVLSNQNDVRYDFTVAPHADISNIKLHFTGQNGLSVNTNGQLVIHTQIGDMVQAKPIAFQEINGKKIDVDCHFNLKDDILSFVIKGEYDPSQTLIIDPTLVFATYSGSTADNWGMTATYDAAGNAYTAGIVFNPGYPVTTGAFQMTFNTGGGMSGDPLMGGSFDISISKFNPTGTNILFSTYLGGGDQEAPTSIVADNNSNLFVLGRSYSNNFPVTSGTYKNTLSGGSDLIISKFNATGTQLLGSTYVGGSGDDGVNISATESYRGSLKYSYADDGRSDIVLDNNNNVFVASCTKSVNFPTTAGAYQTANKGMQDGCAFKMNSTLSTMLWSTYLGGTANDAAYNIAVNSKNEAYVTGGTESNNFPTTTGVLKPAYSGAIDGFVTHISPTGSLLQSTYLGTTGYDQAYFIQTDKSDNVYVCGQTSGKYPITAGVYSVANSSQFIHEMNSSLSTTVFSTEFGSGRNTPDICLSAFLVDNCQNIYISGWASIISGYNNLTSSTTGLAVTANAYRGTTIGDDFYFMVLTRNAASLLYGTFFGGTQSPQHVDGGTSRFDPKGTIYQAMCQSCGGFTDMPTTPGAWSKTNKSSNCNSALVKMDMNILDTVTPSHTNVTCYGMNDGSASVTLQGGIGLPVTYTWMPGGNTTKSVTNLSAGTYTCIVTVCSPDTIVFQITQPPQLRDSITSVTNI